MVPTGETESEKIQIGSQGNSNCFQTCLLKEAIDSSPRAQTEIVSMDLAQRDRADVRNKTAIRLIRTYFRKLFKDHHKKIVKQRLVNCKLKEIFNAMKHSLLDVLVQEEVNDDLVYYLIGILDFKPVSWIP